MINTIKLNSFSSSKITLCYICIPTNIRSVFFSRDSHKSTLQCIVKHNNAEGKHKTQVGQVDSWIISQTSNTKHRAHKSELFKESLSSNQHLYVCKQWRERARQTLHSAPSWAQRCLTSSSTSTRAFPCMDHNCWNPLPTALQRARCTMNFTLEVNTKMP